MILVLVVICGRACRVPAADPTFALVSSLVLVVTLVVIPMTSLYNQILLLPAVLLLVRNGAFLWREDRLTRQVCIISASLMLWPWLAALALSLASLLVPGDLVQKVWAAPLWTSMTIPLGVLLLLARFCALTQPSILTRSVAHPVKLSTT
jgi:hypothetical protein